MTYYTRYEGGTLDPSVVSVTNASEQAFILVAPIPGESEVEIEITPRTSSVQCLQYHGGWRTMDGAVNTVRIPVEPGATSVVFIACR